MGHQGYLTGRLCRGSAASQADTAIAAALAAVIGAFAMWRAEASNAPSALPSSTVVDLPPATTTPGTEGASYASVYIQRH